MKENDKPERWAIKEQVNVSKKKKKNETKEQRRKESKKTNK